MQVLPVGFQGGKGIENGAQIFLQIREPKFTNPQNPTFNKVSFLLRIIWWV